MLPFTNAALMTAGAIASSDPYWSNVVLLAQFNEAAGSTTFTDATGRHTFTTNGGAVSGSGSPPPFQSTNLALDGSGDFLTSADSADWDFGAGDFTIEYYGRHDVSSTQCPLAQYGSTLRAWGIFEDTALQFFWSTDGTTQSSVTATFSGGSWKHRAVSRVGNTVYLCFDGQVSATASMSGVTINNSTRVLSVGGNTSGTTAQYDGGMAGLRITKGVGRYSGSVGASYTVPPQPYPTS